VAVRTKGPGENRPNLSRPAWNDNLHCALLFRSPKRRGLARSGLLWNISEHVYLNVKPVLPEASVNKRRRTLPCGIGAAVPVVLARHDLAATMAMRSMKPWERSVRATATSLVACDALRHWEQFRLSWLAVLPHEAPVDPGTTLAVRIRHLGFWSLNGARVVGARNSRAAGSRWRTARSRITQSRAKSCSKCRLIRVRAP
jgi:hypothetical protein